MLLDLRMETKLREAPREGSLEPLDVVRALLAPRVLALMHARAGTRASCWHLGQKGAEWGLGQPRDTATTLGESGQAETCSWDCLAEQPEAPSRF